MVTINLMLVLKIISLILLGIALFSLICYSVKKPEEMHFITILIGSLIFILPIIYICLN